MDKRSSFIAWVGLRVSGGISIESTNNMIPTAPSNGGHTRNRYTMRSQVSPTMASTSTTPNTRSSRYALDAAADAGTPFYILHGDRDIAVPHRTSEDAARRVGADLITVEKAGHSWLLTDPETLPAIIAELLQGKLGDDLQAA